MHGGWLLLLVLQNGAGTAVAVGQEVCPYVKSSVNPRLFVVNAAGEYVIAGDCEPAPEQTQFVGVPAISGIVNPGNMQAIHKGSMQAIFPAGQMAAQHD